MDKCNKNCLGCESGNPEEQGCLSSGDEEIKQLRKALEKLRTKLLFRNSYMDK